MCYIILLYTPNCQAVLEMQEKYKIAQNRYEILPQSKEKKTGVMQFWWR